MTPTTPTLAEAWAATHPAALPADPGRAPALWLYYVTDDVRPDPFGPDGRRLPAAAVFADGSAVALARGCVAYRSWRAMLLDDPAIEPTCWCIAPFEAAIAIAPGPAAEALHAVALQALDMAQDIGEYVGLHLIDYCDHREPRDDPFIRHTRAGAESDNSPCSWD
jgi:hypothetical protein